MRRVLAALGACGLVVAASAPAMAQSAGSSVFTVDTASDGRDAAPGDGLCATSAGGCSLRAAVDEANAGAVPAVIEIATGVHPSLTVGGADEDRNATGDLDTRGDITIRGAATIEQTVGDRVLDHHSGTLTVVGVTITGGSVRARGSNEGTSGAGLLARADLVLLDATVVGNTMDHGVGEGVGLAVVGESTKATVRNSTISGNRAEGSQYDFFYGGGIHVSGGTLSVADSVLEDNLVTGGDGGAIHAVGATVTIERSTLTGNIASGHYNGAGGGIFAFQSQVTVVDSVVRANEARAGALVWFDLDSYANGGGVDANDSDVTIVRTTLEGNHAAASTQGRGGGIALNDDATLELTDSTLRSNTTDATSDGGSAMGGGLWVSGPTATVGRSTIVGNRAGAGAALYVNASSAVTVDRSTVHGNGAPDVGAVVHGPVEVTASTVTDNDGRSTFAGGMLTTAGSILDAGNGPVCATPATSGGYNLANDTSCGLTAPGDAENVNPGLSPLGRYGGPTVTRRPGAGSPAVDVIPAGTAGLCDATKPTDQRGLSRPAGAGCDIGSFERRK